MILALKRRSRNNIYIDMEPMKSKIKGMFTPSKKPPSSTRDNVKLEDWEIRPGGMLVQKRNSGSNQNPISIPMIKVRVKFGSSCHEICIGPQASFGELKNMLAEHTGVHPQDQKLIYKKKERDSKSFLDVSRVKNGSKIVLIEDITSREMRRLEMLKSAKIDKASKSLQQISLEVHKLVEKVTILEASTTQGRKVAETDVDNLIEMLMTKLVELDGIVIEGDLKLQKKMQEKRVQKYIETLDKLKLETSEANSNECKTKVKKQEDSIPQMPMPTQKQKQQPVQAQHKQESDLTVQQKPKYHQPLKHLNSVVVTTTWETFD